MLEQGDDVGGTWRDNTYPGCARDIPSPLYSFSFAQNPDWHHLFAPQPEILDYLRGVSSEYGIGEHTRFGVHVVSADWNDADRCWEVRTDDGQMYRSRFLVSGMGVLHHPSIPTLPGIDAFTGPVFHSAQWDHEVDLRGKDVVVVGTGASAIQFVPAIVDDVAAMTVFQRSAPWIMPKANKAFDEHDRRRMRRNRYARWRRRNSLFWTHEKRAAGFVSDPEQMGPTKALAESHLRRQVPDPALRAKLTPDYKIGCKRLLISSDWYPALGQPQVTVETSGVAEVGPTWVRSVDGTQYPADVIIFGTGFDAQNAWTRTPIRGLDGISLADSWSSGPEAYLGTTVAGFPNLFLLCGPNTGLGHNSQVFMIEAQARYMIRCMRLAGRDREVRLRPPAQRTFNTELDAEMDATVWQTGGCTSWYQNPRTGRNTLLWPGTSIAFWRRTRRVRRGDYTFTRP